MTKFTATIASAAAALLLSGTAFAASPAAGEGPFFNDAPIAASTLQRQDVRMAVAGHLPASGEMSAQAAPQQASDVTRAEVRQDTREAIAHGFVVKSGELS